MALAGERGLGWHNRYQAVAGYAPRLSNWGGKGSLGHNRAALFGPADLPAAHRLAYTRTRLWAHMHACRVYVQTARRGCDPAGLGRATQLVSVDRVKGWLNCMPPAASASWV
eukprot:1158262-Pelagomonas_calceolata.AAC.13